MMLTLNVISNTGAEIKKISLNQESITIGRKQGNTLVLEDPKRYISSQHAVIDCQDSNYFITDISSNGVLINSSINSIGSGNKVKLNDGDQLHIGDYTIGISISQQQEINVVNNSITKETFDFADDPFADLETDSVQEMIDENQWKAPSDQKQELSSNSVTDLDDDFDFDSKLGNDKAEIDQPPVFKEAFQPYNAEKKQQSERIASDVFGDDWLETGAIEKKVSSNKPEINKEEESSKFNDLFGDDWITKTPDPEPDISETGTLYVEASSPQQAEEGDIQDKSVYVEVSSPQQAEEGDVQDKDIKAAPNTLDSQELSLLMDNFLRGAGLNNLDVEDLTPESFYIIGKILRASVQGTMDVLIGRAKIKNEMHLDVTMIRSKENNPVKFSVSADEAIKKLLAPKGAGYLPAEEAIEEVFDDIRAHQFSVIAGMQTALLEVLKRFDPEKLEQRFQKRNPISASIPIHKQAKLWGAFEHLYNDIEQEATDNFYRLFGQAFSESYEQQINKLKESKKNDPF